MRVLATTLLLWDIAASTAAAAPAYFSGSDLWTFSPQGELGASVQPLTAARGAACATIAIAPNGADGYVTCPDANTVVVIDLAASRIVTTIPVPGSPWAIAVAPDGTTAYAETSAGIVPIDLATNTAEPLIALPLQPAFYQGSPDPGLAITPDGSTLLVADPAQGALVPIDLSTRTIGATVTMPGIPVSVAVTPDGDTAYVVSQDEGASGQPGVSATNLPGELTPVALPSLSAEPPIALPPSASNTFEAPHDIAISPDGTTAYIAAWSGVVKVDLAARQATRFEYTWFETLAFSPDGQRLFASNPQHDCPTTNVCSGGLAVLDAQTGADETERLTGYNESEPWGVAVPPDPHAAFTAAPGHPDTLTTFDASGSTDAGGLITTYSWDFGDGTTATTLQPTVGHVYSHSGTYDVTLTTANQGGCASRFVFTGQTDTCTGQPTASVSETIAIVPTPVYSVKPPPAIAVRSHRLRITGRHVTVRLTCPAALTNSKCRGAVTLSRGQRRLVRRRFAIPRGSTRSLRLPLSAADARALRHKRRATLTIASRGASPISIAVTLRQR